MQVLLPRVPSVNLIGASEGRLQVRTSHRAPTLYCVFAIRPHTTPSLVLSHLTSIRWPSTVELLSGMAGARDVA